MGNLGHSFGGILQAGYAERHPQVIKGMIMLNCSLVFYGRTDWMAGPHAYKGVQFPHLMLWGSDVGHMPFLENKADLGNALATYERKYGL